MHINEFHNFNIITSHILTSKIITLNMKQNRHPIVELETFQDFHINLCLLINMHDIINKINRAHLRPMGYQCTPI